MSRGVGRDAIDEGRRLALVVELPTPQRHLVAPVAALLDRPRGLVAGALAVLGEGCDEGGRPATRQADPLFGPAPPEGDVAGRGVAAHQVGVPADRHRLGDDGLDPLVVRSHRQDVAARIAGAPDADPLGVDLVTCREEGDGILVGPLLGDVVELLAGKPVALARVGVVEEHDHDARPRPPPGGRGCRGSPPSPRRSRCSSTTPAKGPSPSGTVSHPRRVRPSEEKAMSSWCTARPQRSGGAVDQPR